MVRTKEMPANPKQVLNCIVDAEESLGLAARLEAAHLSFSLSGPLVRDLGPVVLIWPSHVENRWNQLSMDDDVAPQLVGDEAVGSRPLAFHEFPEEPPGSPTIASLLEQNVDRVPVLDHPEAITVRSGQGFGLGARATTDPDGDSLSYFWFQYPEAGSCKCSATINGAENGDGAWVTVPEVEAPETVHIILRVTDKGSPPLSRYKRIIVTVTP